MNKPKLSTAFATLVPVFAIPVCVAGCGGANNNTGGVTLGVVGIWATTSVQTGSTYAQQDRLSNPVVNEVFATFANDRHKSNNLASPDQDSSNLSNDIQSFMTQVAGRSQATTDVVKAVFSKDTMLVNLGSAATNGSYLGVQTNGATGSTFGGRELSDDVVDVSLGVVFGTTISALGLAPADGNQIPTLTSDNVGSEGKHFTSTFPYVGSPR